MITETNAVAVTTEQATAADEAADYLVTLHRDGQLDLHAHAQLAEFVTAWFGGWERDGMDEADDQQAEIGRASCRERVYVLV